ncbi:MAG: HAD family hydrolase [Planctomycetota bacterium]|jgi:phosphoglycolate phosphatase
MNLSKYKHVIWDWNGTLINDTSVCAEIVNVCLRKRGIPLIDIDIYRQAFDLPVINFYKRIGFDCSEQEFQDLSEEFLDIYEHRQYECSLQDGTAETLDYFAEIKVEQSILSAYQQHRLEKAIEHFGIVDYFKYIHGRMDSLAAGKAEIARELTKKLDCDNNSMLLIGDTTHDFEVAQIIGADCVLISNGHHSDEKLQNSRAVVLGSLHEILKA